MKHLPPGRKNYVFSIGAGCSGNLRPFATANNKVPWKTIPEIVKSVISSQDSGLIMEFCPKVFALMLGPALRMKTVVVEFGAEPSTWTVTNSEASALSTVKSGR